MPSHCIDMSSNKNSKYCYVPSCSMHTLTHVHVNEVARYSENAPEVNNETYLTHGLAAYQSSNNSYLIAPPPPPTLL